ncbi:type II toxin-antitoxin system RelE/ParE family toxin [Sulfitobacter aestuarii]|uniref:Type II toxin-antitoxin system RelE/ParE family toxin n=1 Tax=Sulfitobacter aestuarii TaxID=2161676 RepID=A0ABW5U1D6_9RHOB
MSRGFRLTRQAEDHLVEIALWTLNQFGPRQADLYETEILQRCAAIAAGSAPSQDCTVLLDGAEGLRFSRAGAHFIVFLDRPDAVVILDFLHASRDLPRHLAALATRRD